MYAKKRVSLFENKPISQKLTIKFMDNLRLRKNIKDMNIIEMYERTTNTIRSKDKWFWIWLASISICIFFALFVEWLKESEWGILCVPFMTLISGYALIYIFYVTLFPIVACIYIILMKLGPLLLGLVSGLSVFGYQCYLFLRSGNWHSFSLFKLPISEDGAWIGLVKIINWLGLHCPFSIVLGVLVSLICYMLRSDENHSQ